MIDRATATVAGGVALGIAVALAVAPVSVLVIGFTAGLTYAVLAMGLVLVYKSGRFINFAHGQIGAFSALLLAKAVIDWGWSYWLALVVAVGLSVAIGAAIALAIVRPLFAAPRLVLMVATIGVAQVLLAAGILWDGLKPDPVKLVQRGYPTAIDWTARLGEQVLRGPQFMILILVPALAALGAVFFLRSRLGLHIRAVAANPDAARLAGVSTRRITTATWMIAGGVSGLTAILLAPSSGTYSLEILGPGLLVRALAPAVVARMSSLPVAFGAGIALGVAENVVFYRTSASGSTEVAVFAVLLLGLMLRAGSLAIARGAGQELLSASTLPRPLPRVDGAAWVPRLTLLAALAAAVLVPAVTGQAKTFQLTLVLVYAVVGMSLVVLTGWSGQLSLGHIAFLGIGAYTAAKLAPEGFSVIFTMLVAAALGAVAAALLGLPSLRVRGMFLGVSTLGFAVLAYSWLFALDDIAGAASVPAARLPVVGELRTQKAVYYLALALLVVVAAALRAVRRSGPGRLFVAVRDNDSNAAAHGVPPSGVRLSAFALSGAVASVAGVVWAHAHTSFDPNSFPPQLSIAMVAMVVIGGVGSLTGAVLGSVLVFGIPIVLSLGFAWSVLLSGLGVVLTLLRAPGGVVALAWDGRDRLVRLWDTTRTFASLAPHAPSAGTVLACSNVTVRFGGLVALYDVDITANAGEIVGLIGTNGAGKTTLMDCISGHRRPDGGRIFVGGSDVTALSPEYRSDAGVARSFQDATLYPGLTVRETVLVALERSHRTGVLSALVSAPWHRFAEREKAAKADAIIGSLGLDDVADDVVASLSTGIRRICDLATVLAQRPSLLLLDEPTAGIAQAEVEQLVPVLRRVAAELSCTIVLIEHDMGLVMALADRIYVLEAGRVIAEGTPAAVRADQRVIASYLGSTEATIKRSRQPAAR